MFCRFLGQSLGAAIFGAIFNAALAARLHAAPARAAPGGCRSGWTRSARRSPGSPGSGQAAADYLRAAITAAIHDVYLGLALAAVATLVGRAGARPPAVRHARGRGQRRRPRARLARPTGRPAPPAGKNPADQPGLAC